jgi:uncharacterized protein
MKVLIAGGTGFLGSALAKSLEASGHEVWSLTRRQPRSDHELQWDGRSRGAWAKALDQADVVVNITGFGLEHWPWTERQKQRFLDSRILPGTALTSAIRAAENRPHTFLQISGINYYGARGEGVAEESWPAAGDYLAQLSVRWEAATQPVEELGVRRVIARSAVVLDTHAGLFPLMALPVKMWVGGPIGDGRQALPWIHVRDEIAAMRLLLEKPDASGAFNLIAPELTSNAEFMQAVAKALHRPYWFRTPAFLLQLALGEMSTLVVDGRFSRPQRLLELGFAFQYPTIRSASEDLLNRPAS